MLDGRKTSVLIVDDEYGLADLAADLLAEEGYDVGFAINGKLGLESLAVRRADLVVVDVMMPVMDGTEMIRRMRADAAFARIPVILTTAHPEAIPKGPDALHDVALVKPFSLGELIRTMERLLRAP